MTEPPGETGSGSGSPASQSTSTSLIERVKAREPQAWRRLVDLYGPVIYRWCRHAGLRPEDAADVGQEVFAAVARGIAQFRHDQPGQTFRGWLWTITQNKIRDHFRQAGRQPPAAVGGSDFQKLLSQVPAEQTTDSSIAAGSDDLGNLVRHALELVRCQFEERTWQAFWRVTAQNRSPTEVGAELGMSATAVRKAKSRVLQRLRQEMGDVL